MFVVTNTLKLLNTLNNINLIIQHKIYCLTNLKINKKKPILDLPCNKKGLFEYRSVIFIILEKKRKKKLLCFNGLIL